jgi:hypothetical protein
MSDFEASNGSITITTDPGRQDLEAIYRYLSGLIGRKIVRVK